MAPKLSAMGLGSKLMTLGIMRVIMTIIIFTGDVVISRYLGVTLKGDYFFLVTNILLIGNILSCGLHVSNIYYSQKYPFPELVGNSVIFFLALTVIVAVLGLPLISYLPVLSQMKLSLKIIFMACFLGECAWIISINYLVLLDQLKQYAKIPITRRGFFLLFAISVWAICSPSLDLVLGFYFLATIIALFSIWFCLAEQSKGLRWRWSSLRRSLGYGLRSQLLNLANEFTLRLNTILLGCWGTSFDNGLFSVALIFPQFFLVVAGSLGIIIQSGVSYSLEHQLSQLEKLCRVTIFFMAIGGVALALAAKYVIRYAYGPDFEGSYILLVTLIPGMVCYSIYIMISRFMLTNGQANTAIISGIAGLIVNILLSSFFIPLQGAQGAALALNGGMLTGTVFLFIMFRLTFNIQLHSLLIIQRNDFIGIGAKLNKIYHKP